MISASMNATVVELQAEYAIAYRSGDEERTQGISSEARSHCRLAPPDHWPADLAKRIGRRTRVRADPAGVARQAFSASGTRRCGFLGLIRRKCALPVDRR